MDYVSISMMIAFGVLGLFYLAKLNHKLGDYLPVVVIQHLSVLTGSLYAIIFYFALKHIITG